MLIWPDFINFDTVLQADATAYATARALVCVQKSTRDRLVQNLSNVGRQRRNRLVCGCVLGSAGPGNRCRTAETRTTSPP